MMANATLYVYHLPDGPQCDDFEVSPNSPYHTASAFSASAELLAPPSATSDPQAATAYLTLLVSRLRALTGGEALVLSRTDAGGGLTLLLVHRNAAASTGAEFVVALLL